MGFQLLATSRVCVYLCGFINFFVISAAIASEYQDMSFPDSDSLTEICSELTMTGVSERDVTDVLPGTISSSLSGGGEEKECSVQNKECTICLLDIKECQITRQGHGLNFHAECLFDWVVIRKHYTCPLCRAKVKGLADDHFSKDKICTICFKPCHKIKKNMTGCGRRVHRECLQGYLEREGAGMCQWVSYCPCCKKAFDVDSEEHFRAKQCKNTSYCCSYQ